MFPNPEIKAFSSHSVPNQPLSMLLLAAGKGTRLQPYTNDWPKCLMPIRGRPLLSYWLETAKAINADKVLVNLHYQSDKVQDFLNHQSLNSWVKAVFESEILGTAGTVRANRDFFTGSTVLLVHADNFCQCDFKSFIRYHQTARPENTALTMMTFSTTSPETCGIVETDDRGIVTAFYEKVTNPPGNRANGAVYLLGTEVLEWIIHNPEITDFSTQVLPNFIGRIATWHNTGIHVDIGNIQALRMAQNLANSEHTVQLESSVVLDDAWTSAFAKHPIHQLIAATN